MKQFSGEILGSAVATAHLMLACEVLSAAQNMLFPQLQLWPLFLEYFVVK